MKEETRFLWRTKWGGRWTTTSYHCTEEHIRKEHPEAIAVPGTRQVLMVPETREERENAMSGNSTGRGVGVRYRADGSLMKWYERD